MEIAAYTYDTPNKDGSWARNLSWHKPSPAGCVNHTPLYTQETLEKAVIAEREACAKVCEAERLEDPCKGEEEAHERAIDNCVAAIRERSNAEFRPTRAASSREVAPGMEG